MVTHTGFKIGLSKGRTCVKDSGAQDRAEVQFRDSLQERRKAGARILVSGKSSF